MKRNPFQCLCNSDKQIRVLISVRIGELIDYTTKHNFSFYFTDLKRTYAPPQMRPSPSSTRKYRFSDSDDSNEELDSPKKKKPGNEGY